MKLTLLVVAFASTLALVGVACGPEEEYCYEQHMTCREAKKQKDQDQAAEIARRNAEKADAGQASDAGVTVID